MRGASIDRRYDSSPVITVASSEQPLIDDYLHLSTVESAQHGVRGTLVRPFPEKAQEEDRRILGGPSGC